MFSENGSRDAGPYQTKLRVHHGESLGASISDYYISESVHDICAVLDDCGDATPQRPG